MSRKRIVITGMGVVSCFGNEVDQLINSLLEGKSGVSSITSFDASKFNTRFAGEIKNFDSGEYIDKKQARRVDKFISYAMVAGKKALEHGGMDEEVLAKFNKARCGIIIGSGMG